MKTPSQIQKTAILPVIQKRVILIAQAPSGTGKDRRICAVGTLQRIDASVAKTTQAIDISANP